jgi:hypothetical protein
MYVNAVLQHDRLRERGGTLVGNVGPHTFVTVMLMNGP